MKINTQKLLLFSLSLLMSMPILKADYDIKNESGKTISFRTMHKQNIQNAQTLNPNETKTVKVDGDWDAIIWKDGDKTHVTGLIFRPKGTFIHPNGKFVTWIYEPIISWPTEMPMATNIKDKKIDASTIGENLSEKAISKLSDLRKDYDEKIKNAKSNTEKLEAVEKAYMIKINDILANEELITKKNK